METASLIISILALLASITTYLLHDRRIKKQEAKINEYQLTKIHEEEIEHKKAQLSGDVTVFKNDSKRILRITNSGKATATNIRMEVLNNINISMLTNPFPYELLNPREHFDVKFYLGIGPNQLIKVKYIWDDSYKKDNEFIQVLQMY